MMNQKSAPFTHLRPTTMPEMLDRAYSVATRFGLLLWFGSFIHASSHLAAIVLNQFPGARVDSPYGVAAVFLGHNLLSYLVSGIVFLAIFQGLTFPLRSLSMKALFRTALKKLPGFVLADLLYLVIIFTTAIVAWGFVTAARHPGAGPGLVVVAVIATIFALWMAIRLCLAPLVCLVEDGNPITAFGRSWQLTSTRIQAGTGRRDRPPLRWLAIMTLPMLIAATCFALVALYGYDQLGVRFPITDWRRAPVTNLLDLGAFLAIWIAAPLYWTGLMAFYVEYRMRHEALDFYLRIRERYRAENPSLETSSRKSS